MEVFEEELAVAANNLEIDEDGDDQEALRLMILSLQQAAYERGLIDGGAANLHDALDETSAVAEVTPSQVTDLMTSLFRNGKANLAIVVTE